MKKGVFLLLFTLFSFYLPAQEVKVIEDLRYYNGAEAHEKHQLDLYVPEGINEPPLMLWIHGGAWAFGDRKNERDLANKFAGKGVAVAVVSYRLSPGTWADPKRTEGIEHPEHIRDIARSFKWLYDHAGEYGYSQSKLFVSGYSAGGHLSALLATDHSYLKEQGLLATDIRAIIPIAGAYDIKAYHDTHYRYSGPDMAEKHVKAVFGQTMDDLRGASPTSYADKLSVPMLLISENQSYDYTRLFEDEVKKAGIPNAAYLHVRELDHAGFYENLARASTSKYRDQMIAFIMKWSDRQALAELKR